MLGPANEKKISLGEGISLAFGSVIGSGILFLPSLTYSLAKDGVGWVWIIATLLCLPLLFVFKDLLFRVKDQNGIASYIALGFGPVIGKVVPLLFLSTVSIGMPSAALIAGDYFGALGGDLPWVSFVVAISIIGITMMSNLMGVQFSGTSQKISTIGLLLLGIGLILITTPVSVSSPRALPLVFQFEPVFLGVTVAFWAYAGFENFTFIVRDFKRPQLDPLISIVVAIFLCGALYLGLAVNYSMMVPLDEINFSTGLRQMADLTRWPAVASPLVSLFALFSVALNFNSWIWGISRMIQSSAIEGTLPSLFARESKRGVPANAIVALAIIFCVVAAFGSLARDIFQQGLIIVSASFVFIYILCVLTFLKLNGDWRLKVPGLVLLALLVYAVLQVGWALLYPILVLFFGVYWIRMRGKSC